MGSGKLQVNTISSIDKALTSSNQKQVYSKISQQTNSDGTNEANYISNDSAVKVNVKQNTSGTETITGTVDTSQLKKIDNSKSVNVTNIAEVKKQAEQYLTPFLSQDEITGLSAYVASQALTQYNNKQKEIVVTKDFDGVSVTVSSDVATNNISFEINKKK
jgi:ABC-type sulfate/molybdate transport systems ATPase subunit